jgi:hypothetical protein
MEEELTLKNIGLEICMSVSDAKKMGMGRHTLPSQNSNENFLMLSNFSHILRE